MMSTLGLSKLAAALTLAAAIWQALAQTPVTAVSAPAACKGTIYLTFDTGSQSQASFIAQTLAKHHIKATFFLANEKTINGDYTLDPNWAPFWKSLVKIGR